MLSANNRAVTVRSCALLNLMKRVAALHCIPFSGLCADLNLTWQLYIFLSVLSCTSQNLTGCDCHCNFLFNSLQCPTVNKETFGIHLRVVGDWTGTI